MLPVVSYFRQEDVFLVIKAIRQSEPEDTGILLCEVLCLQYIMDVSLNEDHSSSFLSFVDGCIVDWFLDGSSKTLWNEELHVLNPLQVVSSGDFQKGEIELVQVRHVPK
ncbi:hypothetical protein ACFX1T_044043 [Malus domestica]